MNKWEARSAVCWRGESLVMMHTTNEATDDRQQPASSSAAESEAHTRPKPKRIKKKYVKEKKKKKRFILTFLFFFSYLSHTHYTIQRDSSSLLLSCSFFVSFFFFFIPQFLLESILLCNHSNWDHGTTESISRLRCQQNTAQPITFLLTIFPQGVLSVCADVRVFHHVHHEPLELAPTHHYNYRNLGIVYTQLLWLPTI